LILKLNVVQELLPVKADKRVWYHFVRGKGNNSYTIVKTIVGNDVSFVVF